MAKLIYDSRGYNSDLSTYENKGITFTSDGYIITHGKVYNATGTLNNLIFADATQGSILYINSEKKAVTLAPGTNGQVLKYNTTDKKPYWDTDNNTTYTLTLNGTDKGTSGGTNLGSFFAPTSVGSNHLILQSGGSGAPSWVSLSTSLSSTTEDYKIPTSYTVKTAISEAITNAVALSMIYKGTINASTIGGGLESGLTFSVGDTYKVNTAGNKFINSSGAIITSGTGVDLKVGDVLIYNGSSWDIVPSGDEVETFIKVATSNISTNLNTALSGTITLGTASLKNALTSAISSNLSSDYLVSASLVVAYVGSFSGLDSTGTVTSIGVGDGLQTSLDNTSWGTDAITSSGYLRVTAATTAAYGGFKLIQNADTTKRSMTLSALTDGIGYFPVHMNSDGTLYSAVKQHDTTYTFENKDATLVWDSVTTIAKVGDVDITVSLPSNPNTNTWRPVNAWELSELSNAGDTADEILPGSTETDALSFGSSFAYDTSNKILDLVWCEIDSSGNKSYSL